MPFPPKLDEMETTTERNRSGGSTFPKKPKMQSKPVVDNPPLVSKSKAGRKPPMDFGKSAPKRDRDQEGPDQSKKGISITIGMFEPETKMDKKRRGKQEGTDSPMYMNNETSPESRRASVRNSINQSIKEIKRNKRDPGF